MLTCILNTAVCSPPLQAALASERRLCASLHVDPANAAAVALYLRFGFTEDGLLTDYYAPGRPALKMIRELGAAR